MDKQLQNLVLQLNKQKIKKPLLFVIRPSYRCNSRCIMCDFWKNKDSGLEFNVIKDAIIDAKDLGAKEIRLTGGEPTIYPYFFEIMMLTKDLGMDFSFITNGFTLSDEIIDMVLKYAPRHIHVSIDSSRPETHNRLRGIKSFEKIMEGLENLKNKNPNQKIVINYVVNNINYEHIPELVNLFGGKLFDELNLIPVRSNENLYLGENQIKHYNEIIVPKIKSELKDKNVVLRHVNPYVFGSKKDIDESQNANYTKNIYEKTDCVVSGYMLFMDSNGAIYPCTNTPYKGNTFLLGNIFEKTITEIWESKNHLEKLKSCGDPNFCFSCDPISCQLNTIFSKKGDKNDQK